MRIFFGIIGIFGFLIRPVPFIWANEPIGTVLSVNGDVALFSGDWKNAEEYEPVFSSNIVKTGKDATSEIMFDNDTVVRFEPETEAEVVSKNGVPEVNLKSGRITSSVVPSQEMAFLVSSPLAIIGVRGTEFTVNHDGNKTEVAVYKGSVEVSDKSEKPAKVKVRAGRQTFVFEKSRPSRPVGLSDEYNQYRKKVLKAFVIRTIKSRQEKQEILSKRMAITKERHKDIIKQIKERKPPTKP